MILGDLRLNLREKWGQVENFSVQYWLLFALPLVTGTLLTLQGGKQFLFNQVFISKFHPAHIVSRKKCICSGLLMLFEYIHVCVPSQL